jgi:hypothetical protein
VAGSPIASPRRELHAPGVMANLGDELHSGVFIDRGLSAGNRTFLGFGGPMQGEVAALGKKAAEVIGRVKEEVIEAVHDEVSAATAEKPKDDSSAKPASGSSLG